MAEAIRDVFGRLDALVNNAGTTTGTVQSDIHGLSMDDWDHVFAVNVRGLFQVTRACLGLLEQSTDAAIVNLCSIAGLRPSAQPLPYAASKGGELDPDALRTARSPRHPRERYRPGIGWVLAYTIAAPGRRRHVLISLPLRHSRGGCWHPGPQPRCPTAGSPAGCRRPDSTGLPGRSGASRAAAATTNPDRPATSSA